MSTAEWLSIPGEDIDANIRRNIRMLAAGKGVKAPALYRPLGLSRQSYSARLNGGRFTVAELLKVASLLEVTVEDLASPTAELLAGQKFWLSMRPDLLVLPGEAETTERTRGHLRST